MARRFLSTWFLAAGALSLLVSFRLYQTGMFVRTQLPLPRLLGLAEVASLCLWALGALLAWGALRLIGDRPLPAWARWATVALYAGMVANVALIGLAVYFKSPMAAPPLWKGLAAAASLALVMAFVLRDAGYRRLMARALAGSAAAVTLLPHLALPLVAHAAWTDQPRIAAVPPVAASPALRPGAPRRIVIVSFDGLRARSTSLYTPALDTTPHLASLAAESHTFLHARAGGDQTLISMPTVLSGARPVDVFPHTRNPNTYIREGAFPSIAARLQAAGYRTTYATSLVSPQTFGFHRDFDEGFRNVLFLTNDFNTASFLPLKETFNYFLPASMRPSLSQPAPQPTTGDHPVEQVVDQGLAYYHSDHDRVFVWIHLNVPHFPFVPVPKEDLAGPVKLRNYPLIHPEVAKAAPEAFPGYVKAYEDYVRFGDSRFGRLLAGMRSSPLWKDTMLVVTSDHGAEIKHGSPGIHAMLEPWEDVTAVPLVIHTPGQRQGQRNQTPVNHEDVVPTILAATFQEPATGFKGSPLLSGPLPADRLTYTWAASPTWHLSRRSDHAFAAYRGRFKYVLKLPTGDEALYDLARDPEAVTDVSGRHPEETAALRAWVKRELVPH